MTKARSNKAEMLGGSALQRFKATFVANGKGGVGKSTLAMFLAFLIREEARKDRKLQLIDCDQKKKLSEFMSGEQVISLGIGAESDDILNDPTLVRAHWDPLAELMTQSDCLIDLGANVDKAILEWAQISGLSDYLTQMDVDVDVFVPMTAEPLAVRDGIALLRDVGVVLPNARRILVLNHSAGGFGAYEHSQLTDNVRKLTEDGVLVAEMPKCLSEGWVAFEERRIPPRRVLDLSPKEIATTFFNGNGLKANRAKAAIGDWAETMMENFLPLLTDQAQVIEDVAAVS